jgi:hypothetical protein
MIAALLLAAQLHPVAACLVRQGHYAQQAGRARPTRAFRRLPPIDRAQAFARCWIKEGKA